MIRLLAAIMFFAYSGLPGVAQVSEPMNVDVVVLGGKALYRFSAEKLMPGLYGSNNYFVGKSTAFDLSFNILFPSGYIISNNTLGLRHFFRTSSADFFVQSGVGLATQTANEDRERNDANSANSDVYDTKSKYSIAYSFCTGLWYKNIEVGLITFYGPLSQHQWYSGIQIGYVMR